MTDTTDHTPEPPPAYTTGQLRADLDQVPADDLEVLVHLPDGSVTALESAGWDTSCDGVAVFRLMTYDDDTDTEDDEPPASNVDEHVVRDLDVDARNRLTAGVGLLGRNGAVRTQIRWSDDEQPVVWFAVATWRVTPPPLRGRRPVPREHHKTGSGLGPLQAVLALCEAAIDGGTCTHCGRPAGLEPDSLDTMPADDVFCWYQYDPSTREFQRGCAA